MILMICVFRSKALLCYVLSQTGCNRVVWPMTQEYCTESFTKKSVLFE